MYWVITEIGIGPPRGKERRVAKKQSKAEQ